MGKEDDRPLPSEARCRFGAATILTTVNGARRARKVSFRKRKRGGGGGVQNFFPKRSSASVSSFV